MPLVPALPLVAAAREALLPDADPLTTRQIEVVRLLASGLHNTEIAQRLSVQLGTVNYHVGQIRERLAATSRVDIVNQARLRGLV